MIKIIGITPHPPIIIPEVGGERLADTSATVNGLKELCRRIRGVRPRRLIVITPHGPAVRSAVTILATSSMSGDFGDFGASQVRVYFEQDQALLECLEQETKTAGLPLRLLRENASLDHGAAVPLYYLEREGVRLPGLCLTPGFLPYRELCRFGRALRRAVERHGLPTAVVASGDLSHRLTRGAPAGFSPRGAEFDRRLVELLKSGDLGAILNLEEQWVEEAGQCGLGSISIALGTLGGAPFNTEIISYEGPFGVGYLTASLTPLNEDRAGRQEVEGEAAAEPPVKSIFVALAEQALRCYLEQGQPIKAPDPLPPQLEKPAGAFVSLKISGQLRGCIGTVEPVRKNLAEEIMANAVSAGVRDPRFPPVGVEELDLITFSVDILSPMERVNSLNDLDALRYGVLVKSGQRSGLLLPDLEGIATVEAQVEIVRRKAGIPPGEPVELYRFTVTRHSS
jgi:AmmeMemoRadiSam system protein A